MAQGSMDQATPKARRPRRFPTFEDYQGAIIDPANVKDEVVRGLMVERFRGLDLARPRTGKFGAVYKFSGNDGVSLAAKVFFNYSDDRELRYRLISDHMGRTDPTQTLVDFRYIEEGIRVNRQWYPMLVMEWAMGETIDVWIETALAKSPKLDNHALCHTWVQAMSDLRQRRIAHGDLQQGNIIAQRDGSFRLIDYDGTFVPAMAVHNLAATELGLSAYQHPKRAAHPTFFNERIDEFAALVILLNLACVDRDLWSTYHGGGDRLLLAKEDLKAPRESPVLAKLMDRGRRIGTLARMVVAAAEGELEQVPTFEEGAALLGLAPATVAPPAPLRATPVRRVERHLPPGLLPDTRFDVKPERRAVPAPAAPRKRTPPREKPTKARPASVLTPRQREVVAFLAAGRTTEQIAVRLGIRPDTVRNHLHAARELVGAPSNKELVTWAQAQGVVASKPRRGSRNAVSARSASTAPVVPPAPIRQRPPVRPRAPGTPAPGSNPLPPEPQAPSDDWEVFWEVVLIIAILLVFVLAIVLG